MKNTFKKYIAFAIVLAIILSLCSCGKSPSKSEKQTPDTKHEKTKINIGGLTGPTTMGIVKLMSDAENQLTDNQYSFSVAGSADELTPKLIKGELDVIIGPANLAAVLNTKTEGNIKILAINVLGVLSVLSKEEDIKSVSDLIGKTIYATGKGSVPEYTLKYILKKNGIDPEKDVEIIFKSEPTEILSLAKTSDSIIAMLPQPFATTAQASVEGFNPVISLSEEWGKLGENSKMVTACIMVRKDFLENNQNAIDLLISECQNSIDWVNSNPKDASVLVEKYLGIKQVLAEKIIPKCSLVCITGDEMKSAVLGFFNVLFEFNSNSLGGKLPDDTLFYIK